MKTLRLIPRIFLFVTLFGFLLTISGCGFRLQGSTKLAPPLHRLYLQAPDPFGPLARHLQQNLRMSGVTLVNTPASADTILNILQDQSGQSLLAVSGTQQTRQYNLQVTVIFEVRNKQGKILVPPQPLVESRIITVQSNLILGSSNEANLFYLHMRRNLARALINRLASVEVTTLINHGSS